MGMEKGIKHNGQAREGLEGSQWVTALGTVAESSLPPSKSLRFFIES